MGTGPCERVFTDPRAPYTGTLPAAIPRTNPARDRARRVRRARAAVGPGDVRAADRPGNDRTSDQGGTTHG
ncbi:hypothetical protein [Streptomyces sp. NPDC019937]|uniref:hypothetical protein n=1 Tax=Streptomyces sp. NPDC019937 TaxID=3154787 RepID=UPI0033D8B48B